MRTLFIFLGVITLFIGSSALAHESTDPETFIVHISDKGFEPKEITIPLGATVIFENEDTNEHWPASDSHPSHTFYSGSSLKEHCAPGQAPTFDSCKGILSGESWSFTFEKAGTHHYHDHLWSHLGGTITVTTAPSSKGNLMERLRFVLTTLIESLTTLLNKNTPSLTEIDPDLLEHSIDTYQQLTVSKDPRVAMEQLETKAASSDSLSAICHDVLHAIGKTAYEKYEGFEDAITYQNSYCNSGYIHGLLEAHLSKTSASSSDVATLCSTYAKGRTAFEEWQCYHGLGHGFMYVTGGDLDAALALCTTHFTADPQSSCVNGVYMEIFNSEVLAKEPSFIDAKDPFSTCDSRTIAKHDCYLYIPTYFSQTLHQEYSDILKQCKKTKPGFRQSCIHGVGSEAMKRNMNTPEKVFALCDEEIIFEDRVSCVTGALGIHIFQNGGIEKTEQLCEGAAGEYRGLCYKVAESREEFFETRK